MFLTFDPIQISFWFGLESLNPLNTLNCTVKKLHFFEDSQILSLSVHPDFPSNPMVFSLSLFVSNLQFCIESQIPKPLSTVPTNNSKSFAALNCRWQSQLSLQSHTSMLNLRRSLSFSLLCSISLQTYQYTIIYYLPCISH